MTAARREKPGNDESPLASVRRGDVTMQNTGLLRRFAAMIYDALLLLALWFMATLPYIAIRGGESVEVSGPLHAAYQFTLLLVAYAFFVGFWRYRGRTLGM